MTREFTSWMDFDNFSKSVKNKARFVHENHVHDFLETLLETSNTRHRLIGEGKYVWRAQLGCAEQECADDESAWVESVAYPPERMMPLLHAAHEGRVNPKGIPCLYAASDKETAMAEVRPWVGGQVSVSQLRIMRELKLIDFSKGHDSKFNFFFEEPPPLEREQHIWEQVDQAFSKPITSDLSNAEYVPTQVIAEYFKNKGFDGLVYKSKLGAGFNFALFDFATVSVANGSLYSVKSVKFEYSDLEHVYTKT